MATSTDLATLRDSDRLLTQMSRAGQLTTVATVADPLVPGRTHERFQQRVNGVPIWAATVTRQSEAGVPISTFGDVYQVDGIDTTPRLSESDARAAAARDAGVELGPVAADLYVLMDRGQPRLVYAVRLATDALRVRLYFISALTGEIIETRDDTRNEVGVGTGVFGPDKKISTTLLGGLFVASDSLRPPELDTFNMRGDPFAVRQFLNGLRPLTASDLGADTDNRWTDAAVVDAHVFGGFTYDYYFKRFSRLGLDNQNLPILNIVHPINRANIALYRTFPQFFTNAGYYGHGLMVYGDGLPPGVLDGLGRSWDYTSGALDVVAHELTHGVTDYTSRLEYRGESGALNEAFSDMMGSSAEFFFQPPGPGRGEADYLLGEDIVIPGGLRSMANPALFGDPDHYSRRFLGEEDNGGVHTNSAIANQAFYLAIEGGTNRTSGLAVQGVGAANRDQMERVFYRAFTVMLPSTANFAIARAATIQAARDLYGVGSAPERAVTQAWTAVGVF